jgi:membrane protease YdiL (CAAX protease family)
MKSLLRRGWDALVHPVVRLEADFPLTGARLGKAYAVAAVLFFAFSFLPALLFVGLVMALVHFASDMTAYNVLILLFNQDGTIKQSTLMALTLVSFVTGFAAELYYLSRVIRKLGYRLLQVVGLTVKPLRAGTAAAAVWAILWRAVVVFLLWTGFEQLVSMLVTAPPQPTTVFARELTGGNRVAWFVMAAVLAPVFEEVVFRGFLFQAVRATLRRCINPANHKVSRLGRWFGQKFVKTAGRADVMAVVFSAVLFSVEHLQFQPVTMLMLFGMGCVLAELFRRTGSLWTGIALHALNNAVATILLFSAR